MPATLRRTLALLLGAVHLVQITGCAGWSAMNEAPGAVIAKYPGKRLRVTRPDSTRVELRGASVASDSWQRACDRTCSRGQNSFSSTVRKMSSNCT